MKGNTIPVHSNDNTLGAGFADGFLDTCYLLPIHVSTNYSEKKIERWLRDNTERAGEEEEDKSCHYWYNKMYFQLPRERSTQSQTIRTS